jgi:hypothetical protein
VIEAAQLKQLDAQQLREVVHSLMGRVATQQAEIGRRDEAIARREREIAFKQATIDKLTHEMAVLKRLKFAATSERLNAEQQNLLQDDVQADLQAMQRELEQLVPAPKGDGDRKRPKRQALPAHLPRREIHHEPENTLCACGCALKRIGEDVAEKLDYEPGVFTVERHVRCWRRPKTEPLMRVVPTQN